MTTKSQRWHIHLIRRKGEHLGTVEAPDAETAIKVAIKELGIVDPDKQQRLAALPEKAGPAEPRRRRRAK